MTLCETCVYLSNNKVWCAAWATYVYTDNKSGAVMCDAYKEAE